MSEGLERLRTASLIALSVGAAGSVALTLLCRVKQQLTSANRNVCRVGALAFCFTRALRQTFTEPLNKNPHHLVQLDCRSRGGNVAHLWECGSGVPCRQEGFCLSNHTCRFVAADRNCHGDCRVSLQPAIPWVLAAV